MQIITIIIIADLKLQNKKDKNCPINHQKIRNHVNNNNINHNNHNNNNC